MKCLNIFSTRIDNPSTPEKTRKIHITRPDLYNNNYPHKTYAHTSLLSTTIVPQKRTFRKLRLDRSSYFLIRQVARSSYKQTKLLLQKSSKMDQTTEFSSLDRVQPQEDCPMPSDLQSEKIEESVANPPENSENAKYEEHLKNLVMLENSWKIDLDCGDSDSEDCDDYLNSLKFINMDSAAENCKLEKPADENYGTACSDTAPFTKTTSNNPISTQMIKQLSAQEQNLPPAKKLCKNEYYEDKYQPEKEDLESVENPDKFSYCQCTNFYLACFVCHEENHPTGLGWKNFYPQFVRKDWKNLSLEQKNIIQQWKLGWGLDLIFGPNLGDKIFKSSSS